MCSGDGAVLATGYFLPALQAVSHADLPSKCLTQVTGTGRRFLSMPHIRQHQLIHSQGAFGL